MKRKYTLGHTWKGLIFGTVLLGLCLGIIFSPLAIIIKHFLLPELNQDIMSGIGGGLTGALVVLSLKIAKWYWYWADRVMARFFGLFRSNGGKQEG